jgi:tyrosyl-DNA phosphodiesterase 2
MTALLRYLERTCAPDIIFFQEVSKVALNTLLEDPWIQNHWISSEADTSKFGKQAFATVTLISSSCLVTHGITLGRIFRIPLPSRFDRNALCCDLLLNSTDHRHGSCVTCLRLINVHLDSLPINPSCRPQQLSTVTDYLRAAGRGIVAGDLNPVLPEDDGLIEQNGLVDAWTEINPTEPGYTWGVEGDKPFPPNRLDKIAMYGVIPSSMSVLPASFHSPNSSENKGLVRGAEFSDHHGLSCVFTWSEAC